MTSAKLWYFGILPLMYNTLMQALPSLSADVIYGWSLMWIGLSYPIMNTMIERRSKRGKGKGRCVSLLMEVFQQNVRPSSVEQTTIPIPFHMYKSHSSSPRWASASFETVTACSLTVQNFVSTYWEMNCLVSSY